MLSFKQFILEKWEDYRTRRVDVKNNRYPTAQFDNDYFDKRPDTEFYKDDNDKPYGMRHKLIPKRNIISNAEDIIPKDDDIIHRGMSHDEYINMLKNGFIQSRNNGNIGDEQKGLTFFSQHPSVADSYSNNYSLTNSKPSPKKPAYIVSIKKPSAEQIAHVGEREIGIRGKVPVDQITAIHRGNVIDYTSQDKDIDTTYNRKFKSEWEKNKKRQSSVSAMARLHWEKIK